MSQWTLNWIVFIGGAAALLYFQPSRPVLYAIGVFCLIMAIRQRVRR